MLAKVGGIEAFFSVILLPARPVRITKSCCKNVRLRGIFFWVSRPSYPSLILAGLTDLLLQNMELRSRGFFLWVSCLGPHIHRLYWQALLIAYSKIWSFDVLRFPARDNCKKRKISPCCTSILQYNQI